jgi:hypothetical protein
MSERRHHPRVTVSWPVRLWVDEASIVGRALDASEWGICVATAPTVELKLGRSYRVDVLAGAPGEFTVAAAVRQIGARGAGMQTTRPIVLP